MTVLVALTPGAIFARDFRVVRPLSEGGMGAVYVVEQLSTGKPRALKIMSPQLVSDPRAQERFAQEARVSGQLKTDHVVEVVGAGIDDATGTPWLAMELLDGEDLVALLQRRGRLSPTEVLAIFEQLCAGLGEAHGRGIVHRDLKPENVFVAVPRRRDVPFTVKILDFGIAKLVEDTRTAATVTSAIGSPLWLAPEQATPGAKVRPATDVWALGLLAFHLLTGQFYWLSARDGQFNLSGILAEALVLPLESASARAAALGCADALPPGFDGWFARCVVRDAAARLENAAAAFQALASLIAPAAIAPPIEETTSGTLVSLPPFERPVGGGPPPDARAPVARYKAPLLGLAAVAVVGLGGAALHRARTLIQRRGAADSADALSPVTLRALRGLRKPVTITAYFSAAQPAQSGRDAAGVRALLDAYRAAGDGRVAVQFVATDSDERRRAAAEAGCVEWPYYTGPSGDAGAAGDAGNAGDAGDAVLPLPHVRAGDAARALRPCHPRTRRSGVPDHLASERDGCSQPNHRISHRAR